MAEQRGHGIVIGAGVSGLIAAIELEKAGWDVTIVDRHGTPGGRVCTRVTHDFPMDEGFQVLLSAYPHVQTYLQLDQLDLVTFSPGAVCMNADGSSNEIGDPRRDWGFLPTVMSSEVASWGDKWRLFRLINELRGLSLSDLFNGPETPTRDYLRELGFSSAFLSRFLHPFLAGIFLDSSLETSSRMARFVLKMFGEGSAVIPRQGMKAIPQQLADSLTRTTWLMDATVVKVSARSVQLASGETLDGDMIIVASGHPELTPSNASSPQWRSVDTLYFNTRHPGFGKPILGLLKQPEHDTPWVNNFHFLHDVFDGPGQVVSVTVTKKHALDQEALQGHVRRELQACGVEVSDCVYHTTIQRALPVCRPMLHTPSPAEIAEGPEGVFYAGDHLTNPSLQGAMESGRCAALAGLRWMDGQRG